MTRKLSRFWVLALLALPLALLVGACSDDDDKVTDPPAPVVGACCLPDGECEVLTSAACVDEGGTWQGGGTVCDPNPCEPGPPPDGACCLPDGSCEVMTQADCATQGGVWQGRDTVCDPDPCGDDGIIPGIPAAEIVGEVDFGSQEPGAIEAQAIVQGQLEMASSITEVVGEILSPLGGADWDYQGGGCYTWSQTEDGCTWTYTVCEDAAGLEWTLMLDGDCDADEGPFDNYVVIRGWSDPDGGSGWFRFYDYASGNVLMSWAWDVAQNGKSGTWDFYLGDPVPENLWARMTWEEMPDGSQHIEWLMVNMVRWEMDVSADGTEGWMKYYSYDSDHSVWRLFWEIVWYGDGTGSNTMYDSEGNPVNVETW